MLDICEDFFPDRSEHPVPAGQVLQAVPGLGQLMADKPILKKARISPLSENEECKLKLIEEVSVILKGQLETEFDDQPVLEEILDFICTA